MSQVLCYTQLKTKAQAHDTRISKGGVRWNVLLKNSLDDYDAQQGWEQLV